MFQKGSLVVCSLFLVANTSFAVTSATSKTVKGSTTTSLSEAAIKAPSEQKIIGVLEFRPSWTQSTGKFHTENMAQLGYQFNKNTTLSYRQYFNTNIYNPDNSEGLGLTAQDGLFVADFRNIWTNSSQGLSFGYEPRLYLPTATATRDAGMITVVRNYLKLTKKFSDKFSLTAMEIPILHIYSRSGTGDKANPVFENRVYLIASYSPVKSVSIDIPLMLNSQRTANYNAVAKNNDRWGHILWSWPEVTYAVSPNTALGVGFMTDNLIRPDFSALTIGDGFRKGVAQMILRATL